MRHNGIRLDFAHRVWLACTFTTTFVTGTVWWVLHNWFQSKGEFGLAPHPAEYWLIRLHGGAAMITLILIGTLLTTHIKRAWQARRNRRSGGLLLALNVLLSLTGYMLYYTGGESFRTLASNSHLALGFALPVLLTLHIVFGSSTRPELEDELRAGEEDESVG